MMKLRSPIVTLLCGLVLALVLWALGANAAAPKKVEPKAVTDVQPTSTPISTPNPVRSSKAPVAAKNATYVGQTDDGAASVAIALRTGQAIAYVCSGKIESWLQGTAFDGKIEMTGTHNGVLTATISGTTATGTVKTGGKTWKFSAEVAQPPSGLYRSASQVNNAKVVAGWVVLKNGDQVGMVETNGVEKAAPAIDTATRTAVVDGNTLTATPIDGEAGTGFDGF